MSKDGKTPPMLPSLVVGLLREKIRQRDARIAVLEAKNAGLAVENEQLGASLGQGQISASGGNSVWIDGHRAHTYWSGAFFPAT